MAGIRSSLLPHCHACAVCVRICAVQGSPGVKGDEGMPGRTGSRGIPGKMVYLTSLEFLHVHS